MATKNRALSIGELSRRSGIAASAIRYYESEGLIAPPPRHNGRRLFDESAVDELALIDLAKSAGFTVAEIRKLLSGFARRTPPSERWRALAQSKLSELDDRIAEAERMKTVLGILMHCRCPTLEDCRQALSANRQPGGLAG